MNTKYTNVMLTIIAACLLLQVVLSLWELENKPEVQPVSVKALDIGETTLPVSIKDSEDLNVNITGIYITPPRSAIRTLGGPRYDLPVSIDAVNGQDIRGIRGALPVEISR